MQNINKLINHSNGNLVIQHIIYLNVPYFNELLANYIKQDFNRLAKMKFSSNVIDKVNN